MVTKEQEYRAEILKISGFAFLAPFGKIALSILYLSLSDLTINTLLYIILTLGLAVIGIIFLLDGINLVKEKDYN